MPIDKFEGRLAVRTRDEIVAAFLRDFKLRQPKADTAPKSQPYVIAQNFADQMMPLYADVPVLGDATTIVNARGAALVEWGRVLRRPRQGAAGAVGYVTCTTATGGSNVVQGDVIKELKKNLAFEVIANESVSDGGLVAIRGLTTGPATNLDPGTILTWENPRAGMAAQAVVFQNANGSGLVGGANQETEDEWRKALLIASANPTMSGNEAEVVQAVMDIPGVALQAAFVYPAVLGPGTKSVAVTLRPGVPGGSRLPTNAHLTLVEAALKSAFPSDDGIVMVTLLEHTLPVVLRATWRDEASGFVDQDPFPAYYSPTVKVTDVVSIKATSFRVTSAATVAPPAVGKTIALYNSVTRQFVAKRIKTVTEISANHTWDLTFETTVPTSDTTFVPANGAIVSPWAASMTDLVDPILAYFDAQGPGELFSSFDDPGRRRRRYPSPTPTQWPNRVENRLLDPVFSFVSDITVAEPSVPFATTVGTPPGLAYLHRCSDLAVYPQ